MHDLIQDIADSVTDKESNRSTVKSESGFKLLDVEPLKGEPFDPSVLTRDSAREEWVLS